jgi:tripartite-type tricarboxylate transporter receptor subunit TctC
MITKRSRARLCGARRKFVKQAAAAGLGLATSMLGIAVTYAADYPNKQLVVVVGYAPGGSSDTIARVIAQNLFPATGKAIVDNKPGASGKIAAQLVGRAPADGYSMLLGHTAEISINKFLSADYGSDPDKDLVPVALIFSTPHAIAVASGSRYATLQDLLADARANPGKISFASAGLGTPGHLAGEQLARGANVRFNHVPYKGVGQAVSDVLGGHVDFYFVALPAAMPYVKSNQIRLLAMTSTQRVKALPNVPTVSEITGIAPYDFPVWGGVFVPTGTPADIVAALNKELNDILAKPDVKERLASLHAEVSILTPAQFGQFVREENAKYQKLIKDVGLKQ